MLELNHDENNTYFILRNVCAQTKYFNMKSLADQYNVAFYGKFATALKSCKYNLKPEPKVLLVSNIREAVSAKKL